MGCMATGMGEAARRRETPWCGCGCGERHTSRRPRSARFESFILLRTLGSMVLRVLEYAVLSVASISRCRVVCAADHNFLAEWSAQPQPSCHEGHGQLQTACRRPPPDACHWKSPEFPSSALPTRRSSLITRGLGKRTQRPTCPSSFTTFLLPPGWREFPAPLLKPSSPQKSANPRKPA
jgi:hypothetical protein